MVTGSFAANYYAVPRMTRDIDLVVELSAGDADRFCALFEGDFYLDRDAVRAAIASRGTFNLIHQAHVVKVDCIVRKDSEYRRTEFARQRRGPWSARRCWRTTPTHRRPRCAAPCSCASTATSSRRPSGRGFWRGWARTNLDPRGRRCESRELGRPRDGADFETRRVAQTEPAA